MSKYLFGCEKCNVSEYREFSMEKYDEEKNKQFCPKCKQKMQRILEPLTGSVQLCSGMYGVAPGGWGS